MLIYNNIDESSWKTNYNFVFKCTKDTYIQWLQSRIIHRILPTNSLLKKMNIADSDLCSFCGSNEETLNHLFWDCVMIKPLINYILDSLSIIDPSAQIKDMHVLLGYGNSDYKVDILLLEFKRYIFLCKKKHLNPSITGFQKSLKLAWSIFKATHVSDKDIDRWSIVRNLLNHM
jgi:hypothetical protein